MRYSNGYKPQRLSVLALTLATLVTAACSRPAPTDANAAEAGTSSTETPGTAEDSYASAIFNALPYPGCVMRTVVGGTSETYVRYGEAIAQGFAFDKWRKEHIEGHPETYQLLSTDLRGPGGYIVVKKYRYLEDGHDMALETMRTTGPFPTREWGDYMQVAITFCAWVPSHVALIDTRGDPSGGSVEVRYALRWKETNIAGIVAQAGMPSRFSYPGPPEQSGEAMLTRVSATSPWQVQFIQ